MSAIYLPHRRKAFTTSSTFTYSATSFSNASTYLSRTVDWTTDADSTFFLMSLWFKRGTTGATQTVWVHTDNSIYIFHLYFDTDNKLYLEMFNLGGLIWNSANTITDTTTWHHIAISLDASTNSKTVYIDGVSDSTVGNLTNVNVQWTSAINQNGFCTDDTLGTQLFNASICEPYLCNTHTSYYDLSIAANLQKFRSVAGKPVNLGANGSTPTGTIPLIYMHGDYTTFNINNAGKGDWTTSGTLAAASDKP